MEALGGLLKELRDRLLHSLSARLWALEGRGLFLAQYSACVVPDLEFVLNTY